MKGKILPEGSCTLGIYKAEFIKEVTEWDSPALTQRCTLFRVPETLKWKMQAGKRYVLVAIPEEAYTEEIEENGGSPED